jgi:hypothetical protein
MSKWIKIAAAGIAAVAMVVLVYAVITPAQNTDTTDHVGMWGMHDTYASRDVSMIAVSAVVIVASLMVIALWKEYEPLPSSMAPPSPAARSELAEPSRGSTIPALAEESSPDEVAAHNYLVLRLLTGDERTMYKAIMDTGGEALQKDLIQRTKMSNAKVSRVLDRLSEKDVITKERHGATNRIRIKLDR